MYNFMSVNTLIAHLVSSRYSKIRKTFENPHRDCTKTEVNRTISRKLGFPVSAATVPRLGDNETECSVR